MRISHIHPLIDIERQKIARRYRGDNRKIDIASLVLAAFLLFILLYFDFSQKTVRSLEHYLHYRMSVIIIYFSILYLVYSFLSMPFAYISDYRIERKYGFSKQNQRAWFLDWVKSFCVTYILGLIVFSVIYALIPAAPALWWLWLSLIMISFSIVLTNIFPVIILPLFYKVKPLEDDALMEKINELCSRATLEIRGVFTIDLSNKTTKANAAVTGLGNTKRILIGDTLVARYDTDEILSALAHEIIHYREHHTWWLILGQSLITVFMFYVFYRVQPYMYNWFGFTYASEIAAFPLFVIIFAVLSYLFRPLGAALSRYCERRADNGALKLTMNPDAFIRLMAKLCNEHLSIAYPCPIVEWYNYSHPSAGRRIQFAEDQKKLQRQVNGTENCQKKEALC